MESQLIILFLDCDSIVNNRSHEFLFGRGIKSDEFPQTKIVDSDNLVENVSQNWIFPFACCSL